MAKIVYKVGDDISTDVIYPGRFMASVLPAETPQYAFADDPEFNKKLNSGEFAPGSILLGGKNFGCGSSREQAASCLKGHDIVIIAKDVARIFMQNAINLGLRTVIAPEFDGDLGDDVEITDTEVVNKTKGKAFPYQPLPAARQAIVDAGGLIPYARQKLLSRQNQR